MDEKGKIISTCDIDDNLSLQIWTKGKTPRLVIFNKNKNSKKLIHLSWVEIRDRKLSINSKVRGQTVSYTVQDFEPAIQRILTEYVLRTNFRIKFYKLVIDLEKAVFNPEIITSSKDMTLMTEDKRSSLWIADCSGEDKRFGMFRPFFPVNENEKNVINEEKLKIIGNNSRGIDTLINSGVIANLKSVNPERWHNPIRVTAAAMLLVFSYCNEDGSKFSESLWDDGSNKNQPQQFQQFGTQMIQKSAAPKKNKAFSIHDANLMRLGHKLVAYMRHFYEADKLDLTCVIDSDKELQDSGYVRSRRVDFHTGSIGDVPYKVTFYENESENMIGLGCIPQLPTAKHSGHLLLKIPTEIYKRALQRDTMGGPDDDYYTITRLLWTRQFKDWYENVKPYVRTFAGLNKV